MKKLIATILTIVMLTGIAGVVPAYAEAWTPTSTDDGYTKVLANCDMSSLNGITGTQKMSDPGFDGSTFNTDDWSSLAAASAPYFSLVSAADANLPDAAAHGNVVKHTGAVGDSVTAATCSMVNTTNVTDGGTATKTVVQADMYIDVMVNNFVELTVNGNLSSKTQWNKGVIRLYNGGIVKAYKDSAWVELEDVSFQTKKWFTITVAFDMSATDKVFSVWFDDVCIVNNQAMSGTLSTCDALKHFSFYMSWNKGKVTEQPTVYWDNMRVYTGDVSVSGSPCYSDMEILGATVVDSPKADDGHGKVLEVAGGTYFVKSYTNPVAIDSEYTLAAPSDAKIVEFGQVKLEADVYLPEATSRAKIGVRYVNDSGAEADLDLIALDSYDKATWHTVVVYIDAVNGKYTSYVNGEKVDNDKAISVDGFAAPRSMYVGAKTTSAYADNIKFSIPEYYSETAGGIEIAGTQNMLYPGIDCDALDSANDWEKPDTSILSITTAADEDIALPATYGNVIKHVGLSGEIETAGSNNITTMTINGSTKAVIQTDMYIKEMPTSHIDLFNIAHKDTANKTVWAAETVRLYADGIIKAYVYNTETGSNEFVEIGTFETEKWYNFTLAIDVESAERTISVWMNGQNILDNATPCLTLNECTSLRSFKNTLSWLKGNVTEAPVVYWDNVRTYTGSDVAVSYVKAPVFVQTRQGADEYTLAYVLEGEKSEKAVLIAAVYDEGDLLDSVGIGQSAGALAEGECELLLAEFVKSEGKTLGKMLWEDFNTLKPLMENE